jgi:hypothetical protein
MRSGMETLSPAGGIRSAGIVSAVKIAPSRLQAHCSFCPGIALNDMGHALSRSPNDCRIAHVRASLH